MLCNYASVGEVQPSLRVMVTDCECKGPPSPLPLLPLQLWESMWSYHGTSPFNTCFTTFDLSHTWSNPYVEPTGQQYRQFTHDLSFKMFTMFIVNISLSLTKHVMITNSYRCAYTQTWLYFLLKLSVWSLVEDTHTLDNVIQSGMLCTWWPVLLTYHLQSCQHKP